MIEQYDVIILGGGCSGLSLAIDRAQRQPNHRVLILESRSVYTCDKTWSFWDVEAHPFLHQIEHTWNQWQVQHQGRTLCLDSTRYLYCCIPSSAFYKAAVKQIALLPNLTLLMDSPVLRLVESSSDVTIETNKASYRASKVFDSRPEKTETSLYQHFLGWQVVSQTPLFNAQTVILMDFDVDQSKGLHFIYLLPFSSHEALVESTFISPHIHDEKVYEESISSYLKIRFKTSDYQIIRKERGILPLRTMIAPKKSDRVIPIGAKAGWTRASTGYAFLAIQKAIREQAFERRDPKFFDIDLYLDRIFLAFLNDHPQEGPRLFFDLFCKNSPERLVRFLTGHWSMVDLLLILFSMPKMAMVKQALRLSTRGGK